MKSFLSYVRGIFILSINDNPEIRSLFKGFKLAKEKTVYNGSVKGRKRVTELLISNY